MISVTHLKSIMSQRQVSMSQFFGNAVKFFKQYSWCYDFKAMDILADDVRSRIPLQFQKFFESLDDNDQQFLDILHLRGNDRWPSDIALFVDTCRNLKDLSIGLKSSCVSDGSQTKLTPTSMKLPRKWNPKKFQEVVHVGNFVGDLCLKNSCDAAVDIGSGLGYLSTHLATLFKIPVIGVESEESRVQTAISSYHANSSTLSSAPQTYVCLRISKNISNELEPHVRDRKNVCVTALHACGDLTPWTLKHFVSSPSCKCIAVVPCCYHKMQEGPDTNFPLSSQLKSVASRYEDFNFLSNCWLWRLASQRSGSSFLDDIERETKHLFFRAVLQKYISSETMTLVRRKRNLQSSHFHTFSEYIENTIGENGGFSLIRDGSALSVVRENLPKVFDRLHLFHDELRGWSKVITGVLAMQGAVQSLAEDLILLDRLSFLEESDSVEECGLIKVIPDNVSPRGMVLFGVKK